MPRQRPSPGSQVQVRWAGRPRRRYEGRQRQGSPQGPRGESPWWGGCRSTNTGPGTWGSPKEALWAAWEGFVLVPVRLPRCFGGRGHSGSRNHSPTGWKPGKVVKEGPRDTLSQKVLRMASQQDANARGGGSAGKHPPSAFPSWDWIRWPRSRRRRRWEAGGLSAGPWAVSRGPRGLGAVGSGFPPSAGERPGLRVSPSPFLLCDDPRLFTVIPNRGLSRGEGAPLREGAGVGVGDAATGKPVY